MTELIGRTIKNLQVGDLVSFKRSFKQDDFRSFSKLSGDKNPLHHDQDYAAASQFGKTIVPLHLVASPLSAIAGMMLPGHRSLYLSTSQRALLPVYYDQELTYSAKIIAINEPQAILTIRTLVIHGLEVLLEAEQIVQVRQDVSPELAPVHDSDCKILQPGKRTALITGASGSVGRVTAITLAKQGWNLSLTYRSKNRQTMEILAKQLSGFGSTVSIFEGGLENDKSLLDLTKFIRKNGEITDFIHCASPQVFGNPQKLMQVNFTALKTISHELIPVFLQRQEGRILFIGSSAVQFAPSGWEDYSAAKSAASHYMTSLQQRYGVHGLSSWVLAPGLIRTDFSKELRSQNDLCLMPEQVAEAIAALLTKKENQPGGYAWLEPGIELRQGRFGFHDNHQISRPNTETKPDSRDKPFLLPETHTEAAPLVREFFALSRDTDLTQAGVNTLPGWDSLRHIELMLFLEKRLGIKISSSEIDRTKRFSELEKLTESKVKNG
ncbi:MAG: SDR family NAD(P)-dependent oxidoreductase [Magnetococcales bacterium]|nr:SDR family NAD(P)-dependent oxidoreductase [Magnetococcales bacterium]